MIWGASAMLDNLRDAIVGEALDHLAQAGVPNAVFVAYVGKFDEERNAVADNCFAKTQKNIFAGSRGSVLFIVRVDKAFQIKGTIEYLKDGAIFEDM